MRKTRSWRPPVALLAVALSATLSLTLTACGDDVTFEEPELLELEEVQGVYGIQTVTFDPQGAAEAADILAALPDEGIADPSLNIGRTGAFQLSYREPASGNTVQLDGTVEPREDGIDLVFETQVDADRFLFPLRLPLDWDEETRTLSFSGEVAVDRERLQNLFPEKYGAEPWTSDTIPGILTVRFQQPTDED